MRQSGIPPGTADVPRGHLSGDRAIRSTIRLMNLGRKFVAIMRLQIWKQFEQTGQPLP